MTKEEAIQAMKKGKKIVHKSFRDDYYLILKDEDILSFLCTVKSFKEDSFENGWELYKD